MYSIKDRNREIEFNKVSVAYWKFWGSDCIVVVMVDWAQNWQ